MKFLFIFLLISSCSTGLRVKGGDCPGFVKLKLGRELSHKQKKFILREYGVGKQEVEISDLLKEIEAPKCQKLTALKLSIESDFWDQVISLIPFVSQWTIQLEWDEVQSASAK